MRDHSLLVGHASSVYMCSTTLRHTRTPEYLIFALTLLAFSFLQATGFVGSMMSIWGQPNLAYEMSHDLEIWLPRLLYPPIAILLISQSYRNFIQAENLLTIPVAGALIVAAIQACTGNISPAIFAAMFFVVWINQWIPNPSGDGAIRFKRYIVLALLIYLIAPIVLLCMLHLAAVFGGLPPMLQFIIDRPSDVGLFRSESFRGFTRDRIAYSYLCGIAFLSLLAARRFSAGILICMGLLLFALVMAGSRAALSALVIATCFMAASRKIFLFTLTGGLAGFVAAAFISGRADFFGDPGDRISIIWAYLDHVRGDPAILLTGAGHFGAEVLLGGGTSVRPHAWPLNSILNFGALTTAAWLVFLYRLYRKLNTAGRSVFLYILTVGLFHNGFDAYFFSMDQLLGFALAMSLSLKSPLPTLPEEKNCGISDIPKWTKIFV